MLWIAVGLFVVGVACGALIRLLVFVGVLVGGAVIAGIAVAGQGLGAALLTALVTVIALQVGYVAGFILRALGRSRYTGVAMRGSGKPPVSARLGAKRR
jgi:hypothetical protein